MKKMGIIGGIGPESTVDYYRLYVKTFQNHMNGNYPEVLINCINMSKMLEMVGNGEWEQLVDYLLAGVQGLAKAGADFAIIASNTPHVVFEELSKESPIPLLSIVEVTCEEVKKLQLKKVALFGTGFTMKADFYQKVFNNAGITVVVPNDSEKEYIQSKIFSELQAMVLKEETKQGFLSIVKRMVDEEGIEGLILGCTELPLILKENAFGIRFFNTSQIHINAAMNYISESPL